MALEECIVNRTGELIEINLLSEAEINKLNNWSKIMQSRSEHSKLCGSFTFTLISTIKELINDDRFTDDEKTRLMFLGTYVKYEKREYSLLRKGNGTVIYKSNLQKLLIMPNNKRFYTFYNKLVECKVILEVEREDGNVELYWHSKYHFKGKASQSNKKGHNLIKLFDRQLRDLYNMKDESGKQKYRPSNLYVLFCLLPFIHYETNLICMDADRPANETRPLLLSEIAEMLGISRSASLKRKLLGIQLYDEPVFSIITECESEYIRVNPFIVWRNNANPSAAITETFKATKERLAKRRVHKEIN